MKLNQSICIYLLTVGMSFFGYQKVGLAQTFNGPYNKAIDAPVLIVMGQSNAEGYVPYVNPPSTPFPNVRGLKFTNNSSPEIRDVIWSNYSVSTANNSYEFNLARNGTVNGFAGSHLAATFAERWQSRVNSDPTLPDLYVIHIASSGMGIMSDNTAKDYPNIKLNGWYSNNSNNLYKTAQSVIPLAIQNLINAGKRPIIIGLHWNQWETDASKRWPETVTDNAVAAVYDNFFQGFRKLFPRTSFPIYLYKPLARKADESQNNSLDNLSSAFSILAINKPNLYKLMDAGSSQYYKSNSNDKNYGIFSDSIHYTHDVQKWFAQQQIDEIFKLGNYGSIVSQVNTYESPMIPAKRVGKTKGSSAPSDFNGDKTTELVFSNGTRVYKIGTVKGNSINVKETSGTASDRVFRILALGDFNGDGKSDFLFRDNGTNEYRIWNMNENQIGGTANQTGPFKNVTVKKGAQLGTYLLIGTGDFDGDGYSDLLWRPEIGNEYVIWLKGDPTQSFKFYPDFGWNVEAIGNFDGDSMSDILWRHSVTGNYVIWTMNKGTLKYGGRHFPPSSPEAFVVSVLDFDRDGISDILWYDPNSNQYKIWYMHPSEASYASKSVFRDTKVLSAPAAGDSYAGSGDYDGDGYADILWFNPKYKSYSYWPKGEFKNRVPLTVTTSLDSTWKIVQ